jgi:hypothetical protein
MYAPLSSEIPTTDTPGISRPGLYGFAVELDAPEDGVGAWLTPAPSDWPLVRVRRSVGRDASGVGAGAPDGGEAMPAAAAGVAAGEVVMDDVRARVQLLGGEAIMSRATREALFRTETALDADELVHPMLGYAAAAFANWMGREAFHAGVFLSGGGAWALLGGRGSGKSSTLAWLARNGHAIVADDMLFLNGRTAFVGPRAIDLAAATAAHLGFDEELDEVRQGFRLRLGLPALAPEHRLEGWVSLAWGEELEIAPVVAAARIPMLIEHGHQPRGEANWESVLALAELPTFELRRPHGLESLAQAGELLLARTAAAAGAG